MVDCFPRSNSFTRELKQLTTRTLSKRPRRFLCVRRNVGKTLTRPSRGRLPTEVFSPFSGIFINRCRGHAIVPKAKVRCVNSSHRRGFKRSRRGKCAILCASNACRFIGGHIGVQCHIVSVPTRHTKLRLVSRLHRVRTSNHCGIGIHIRTPTTTVGSISGTTLLRTKTTGMRLITSSRRLPRTMSSSLFRGFSDHHVQRACRSFYQRGRVRSISVKLRCLSEVRGESYKGWEQ